MLAKPQKKKDERTDAQKIQRRRKSAVALKKKNYAIKKMKKRMCHRGE